MYPYRADRLKDDRASHPIAAPIRGRRLPQLEGFNSKLSLHCALTDKNSEKNPTAISLMPGKSELGRSKSSSKHVHDEITARQIFKHLTNFSALAPERLNFSPRPWGLSSMHNERRALHHAVDCGA
jgi:hypothetical protein